MIQQKQNNTIRGYLEGYYGRLLSWKERRKILKHLKSLNMNTYLYAPKEDPLHRLEWRKPYPQKWQKHFQKFCSYARTNNINIIAAIAPGLDYDLNQTTKGDDWDTLTQKCEMLLTLGASQIALLLDDINPAPLSNEAQTHAALANALNDALAKHQQKPLILTPRIYADEISNHDLIPSNPHDTLYWPQLIQHLNPQITLLICGKYVVCHNTSLQKTKMAEAGLNTQNTIIWDNLYAHDYCPRQLYLTPWVGRLPEQNILLNPTGLVETDRLLLSFMDAGDDAQAWKDALAAHNVPPAFLTIAPFFNAPPHPEHDDDSIPDLENPEPYLDALDTLLWQWKTPLAREWYPFLMALKHDILINQNRLNTLRVRKYLPPLLRKSL